MAPTLPNFCLQKMKGDLESKNKKISENILDDIIGNAVEKLKKEQEQKKTRTTKNR